MENTAEQIAREIRIRYVGGDQFAGDCFSDVALKAIAEALLSAEKRGEERSASTRDKDCAFQMGYKQAIEDAANIVQGWADGKIAGLPGVIRRLAEAEGGKSEDIK